MFKKPKKQQEKKGKQGENSTAICDYKGKKLKRNMERF